MFFDATYKKIFEAMPLTDLWEKYVQLYKSVNAVAIRTLLPFSSTYRSKNGFSALM